MKYASKVVEQAKAWLGRKESDGTHKLIIDVYNSHKPLARGYAVQYNDEWCATFVSAVAVKLGYIDIIPTECSCSKMIELLKKLGSFDENDARVPNPGDLIFYDWQDSQPATDNRNSPDHVGIVEKVSGSTITVIEGNYSQSVKRRTLAVNGKYIRGYGVPQYDAETAVEEAPKVEAPKESSVTVTLSVLRKGAKGEQVKALQRMLYSMGYDLGPSLVDGSFGSKTDAAVRAYQKGKKLEIDGVVGPATWKMLLGVGA
jgi:hypothetical protein